MKRTRNSFKKNTHKTARISGLFFCVMIFFCFCFAGCAKHGQPTSESGNDNSEIVTEDSSVIPDGALADGRDNFIAEAVGIYTCASETGDTYAISLYNAYGNLYAQCGIAVPSQSAYDTSLTVMPYSAVEIIPVKAGDFSESGSYEFEVGFMPFTTRGNRAGYYGAPIKGTIALDGDSLSIGLEDGTLCTQWDDKTSMIFERNNDVTDPVTMTQDEKDSVPKNHVPDELYGMWMEENVEGLFCIDIRKGADGEADRIQLYEKTPGKTGFVGRGMIGATPDGSIYAKYRGILADYGQDWNFDYIMDDDGKVIFRTSLGYEDAYTGEEARISMTFHKIEKSDIPLVALFEPDDVTALKGGLSAEMSDGSVRPVSPQFAATDDVENNGGYFVRIGSLIYYRYYSDHMKPEMLTYGQNFLQFVEQQENGTVCWYNPESGERGVAFYDGCTGPLYYINGKFFSNEFSANEVQSFREIYSFWPDGSGKESVSVGSYSYIEEAWGNHDLVYTNFNEGTLSVYDGFLNYREYDFDPFEYCAHIDEVDGKLLVSCINTNTDVYYFYIIGDDGVMQHLSSFYHDKWSGTANPIVEQVYAEDGYIYMGLGCYDQTGIFKNYLVFRYPDVGGEAEIVAEEAPKKGEAERHHFVINAMGEVLIRSTEGGEVILSNETYGDLIWADSTFSATMLAPEYIKKDPAKVKDKEQAVILQTGEVVGNSAYIITATATYDAPATTDHHRAFHFDSYSYSVIPLDSVKYGGDEHDEIFLDVDIPQELYDTAGNSDVSKSAMEAYEHILDIYKAAAEKGLSYEEAYVDPIERSLWDTGWAQGLGGGGYVYYDVNKDGTDELIILYNGEIKDIYGFDGEKAVLAFGVAERESITLYEDGKIYSVFGTMNYAMEGWAEFNPNLGMYFKTAEKTYTPTAGDPKDVQYFLMCAGDGEWEEIEEAYREYGGIPVWAYEISEEITKEEYEKFASKEKEVTFTDVNPL